jgi:hypothetical protein
MVAPANIGAFMLCCMPVTWNSGAVSSTTESGPIASQSAPPTAVNITVLWVCMQPLGLPVVPEV